MRAEAGAAFVGAEQSQKMRRAIAQRHQDAVQLLRSEILAVRQRGDVARQLLELVARNRDAEILAGDVFHLVRFVEDHGAVFGNDARRARRPSPPGRRKTGGD